MSPEAADVVRHAADVVQWVNLIVATIILGVALATGRRWPEARPFLLGPVTWAAHSVVFYGVVLFVHLSGPVTSLWSALLRLHGYLIVLALLVAAVAIMLSPAPPDGAADGDEIDE